MERINVSKEWRLHYTNTTFTMVFANETDTKKALNAMEAAIKEINYENGNADLWLQDLSDSRTGDSFDFESTLEWDEFTQYIPAMLKAVAERCSRLFPCFSLLLVVNISVCRKRIEVA